VPNILAVRHYFVSEQYTFWAVEMMIRACDAEYFHDIFSIISSTVPLPSPQRQRRAANAAARTDRLG